MKMITEQDLNTIKNAIFKNIPPAEIQTAMAMFNVGMHVFNQLERITVSLEQISSSLAVISQKQQ